MADIAVTAANVRSFGPTVSGIAGSLCTQGQPVRKNTSGQWVPAQSNSAVNAAASGIAVNRAEANQPVDVQTSGPITIGGTSAAGKVYIVSGTAGGVAPIDDVAGGEFITIVGVGISATQIKVGFLQSGVAAAGAVT